MRVCLRAKAELGMAPRKAADVAALVHRTSQPVGPTRTELIATRLLTRPSKGMSLFTVPQFDMFMKRAIPDLEVPPVRRRYGPALGARQPGRLRSTYDLPLVAGQL